MGRVSQTLGKGGLFSHHLFGLYLNLKKMGKFVFYAAIAVLLIVLFASTSHGDEESKDAKEAFERVIRDARRRARKGGREPKKVSVHKVARPGRRKNKIVKNKKKSKGKNKGHILRKKGRKG